MANNQTNMPWTIMDGVRGVPQPPVQLPSLPDLGSYNFRYPFPPDVTNGRYLAVPNPQPQPGGTAAALNLPAQPLTPQIFTPNMPPPTPTLEQMAMSPPFNFSAQQLQDMRTAAKTLRGAQIAAAATAGFAAGSLIPGEAPREIAHAATTLHDLYDIYNSGQDADDIYSNTLSQQMNDMLSRQMNNGQLPQGNWPR